MARQELGVEDGWNSLSGTIMSLPLVLSLSGNDQECHENLPKPSSHERSTLYLPRWGDWDDQLSVWNAGSSRDIESSTMRRVALEKAFRWKKSWTIIRVIGLTMPIPRCNGTSKNTGFSTGQPWFGSESTIKQSAFQKRWQSRLFSILSETGSKNP